LVPEGNPTEKTKEAQSQTWGQRNSRKKHCRSFQEKKIPLGRGYARACAKPGGLVSNWEEGNSESKGSSLKTHLKGILNAPKEKTETIRKPHSQLPAKLPHLGCDFGGGGSLGKVSRVDREKTPKCTEEGRTRITKTYGSNSPRRGSTKGDTEKKC